jgi:hypothetical protein
VPAPRGPSLASCSDAIARAVIANIEARQEREEAHRRWSEQAFRAVLRRPDKIALVDQHGHPAE